MKSNEGVKIVQIETTFVETDPAKFRAVVQSLTGKDGSTVWVGNGSSSEIEAEKTGFEVKGGNNNAYADGDVVMVKPKGIIKDDKYYDDVLSYMKLNRLSFKDMERLLSKEELPWL